MKGTFGGYEEKEWDVRCRVVPVGVGDTVVGGMRGRVGSQDRFREP